MFYENSMVSTKIKQIEDIQNKSERKKISLQNQWNTKWLARQEKMDKRATRQTK